MRRYFYKNKIIYKILKLRIGDTMSDIFEGITSITFKGYKITKKQLTQMEDLYKKIIDDENINLKEKEIVIELNYNFKSE